MRKILTLLSLFGILIILLASLMPTYDIGHNKDIDSEVISQDFSGYTAISTPQELSKIGTDPGYPLNGMYYLANDIVFGAEDTNGPVPISMSITTVSGATTMTVASGSGVISLGTAFAGDISGSVSGGVATFSGASALSNGTHKITIGGTVTIGGGTYGFAYTSSHTISSGSGNTVENFEGNGNFYPIGYSYDPSSGVGTESEFTGIFDGNGHVISGMEIHLFSLSAKIYAGLFAKLGTGAEVSNTGIMNGSTVAVSSATNDVYAGGVVGLSKGSVINCYNESRISAVSSSMAQAGGISGSSDSSSSVTGCYNSETITAISPSGLAVAGGISGGLSGSAITNCYNEGSVAATSPDGAVFTGGISGNSSSSLITNCYNAGNVTGSAEVLAVAGGISGYSVLSISNSYNIGQIVAESSSEACAGGIIGYSFGSSTNNSYDIGHVTATSPGGTAYAGGILGYAIAFQTSNITNCYFLEGRITANLSLTNVLFNCSTTPHLVVVDAGGQISNPANSVPARHTGTSSVDGNDQWSGMKTEGQMKPTLSNAQAPAPGNSIYYGGTTTITGTPSVTVPGWDFHNIWTIIPGINEGYPILSSFSGMTISITEHPQDKTVLEGGSVTFSFDATLVPNMLPQYQWYILVPGGAWVAIPGETGKDLSFGPAKTTDDGTQFRVSVTAPDYNSTTVLSQTATLHVLPVYTVTLPTGTGYTVTAHNSSGLQVVHGGSFTFQLSLATGYSGGQVSVNGTPVTLDASGMYTIINITADQTVTVTGVTQNTYFIALTPGTGYTLTADAGSSSPVAYGGSYTFRFLLAAGYSGGQVSVNGTPVTLDANGRYTISNITEIKTVTVTGVTQNIYSVTLPSGTGYTVTAYGGSVSPVTHGSSFTFQFALATGYSGGQVSVNGTPVTLDANGMYTITNITTNQAVTVTGVAQNTYSVTLTQGTGYTLTADAGSSSPVTHGSSFTFVFSLDPGYTSSPYQVLVNGTPVTLIAGKYTISNITEIKTVTVTGVAVTYDTYSVTLPSGTGYAVTAYGGSVSPVVQGGSFTFRFSLTAGYSGGQVSVNGTPVSLDVNGMYTITNITANQTVTVTGVTQNTYSVTLPSGTGYTVTAYGGSASPVTHSGSFTFQFSLVAGYSGGQVSVNGTPVTLDVNGRYTISNITEIKTVTVTGVTQNTYNITLPTGTGYTVTAYGGSVFPVIHGGSFTFQFSLAAGYSGGQVSVNGTPVSLDVNGMYTITNITANQTVTVTGVSQNTYSVTLTPGTGYTLTADAGSSSPVTYGGSFTFAFSLDPGYTNSLYQVLVNGTPVTLTAGKYTISDITEIKTVTVVGVGTAQNTYSVTLPSGTGYTVTAYGGSASPVVHGGSFTFQFSLAAGYSGGQAYVNGMSVTLDANGRYTITNIVTSQMITVSDVAPYTYAIAGNIKEGANNLPDVSVSYTIVGVRSGTVTTDTDGIFIISGIPHGSTVSITGVTKTNYTVNGDMPLVINNIVDNKTQNFTMQKNASIAPRSNGAGSSDDIGPIVLMAIVVIAIIGVAAFFILKRKR